MATSTIPGAVDYLFTTAQALPPVTSAVVVSDGWSDRKGATGIVVGITPEDPETRGTKSHGELGARAQWEEYAVPCIIWAYRAGDRAMKQARDAAFELFDAFDTALRTPQGATLGGVLKSGTALVSDPVMEQTGSAEEAGEGRTCQIYFEVSCRSRSAA
ncbi:hypothetical protein ACFYL6_20875 [Micromonospora sp. NPDC007208]|uniref:hypothetical protein n=1 Tax=Micromonospora sp. NPDC007208 TaxID=3364236 RepID=UPI003691F7EC